MRRPFGGSDRPRVLTARCGNLAGPLALFLGHEVVAVAVATAIPEVHALGGDDIVVVACHPAAAGAGGTRQGADGALDCRKQTKRERRAASQLGFIQTLKSFMNLRIQAHELTQGR